ncbi:hypothetical protein RHGRI_007945 [Rhododendron griersonianum]|uniref:Uncharacterized protein n=1 Tax=Rhododendron griersonianum TaxID=479676 RepID=A0AAV6L1S3_9ERIC|nr:hypothetical protein RHGRI_007945 [Rhododendron griersonianum]
MKVPVKMKKWEELRRNESVERGLEVGRQVIVEKAERSDIPNIDKEKTTTRYGNLKNLKLFVGCSQISNGSPVHSQMDVLHAALYKLVCWLQLPMAATQENEANKLKEGMFPRVVSPL